MKEFVGVKIHYPFAESFKKEAIFFDRIVVLNLTIMIDFYRKLDSLEGRQIASELEWLQDQNLFFDIDSLVMNTQLLDISKLIKELKSAKRLLSFSIDSMEDSKSKKDFGSLDEYVKTSMYSWCRLESVMLRECHNIDAFPIIDFDLTKLPAKSVGSSRKAELIKIILNFLPIPDDSVPWEQILDYRSDPDSKEKVLCLRKWINKVSEKKLPVSEIQDEAEWLMHEYQKHMSFHKMKVNWMTLESFVKVPLEVLENLIKIKWSKLLDPLFVIKKRTVAILEAEMNAPGRELSYVIKTRKIFGKSRIN
jgi:hypothetical protein